MIIIPEGISMSNEDVVENLLLLLKIACVNNLSVSSVEEREKFRIAINEATADALNEEQFLPMRTITTDYVGGARVVGTVVVSHEKVELEFADPAHASIGLGEPFSFFLKVRGLDESKGKKPSWTSGDYKVEISRRAFSVRLIIRGASGKLAYMLEFAMSEFQEKMEEVLPAYGHILVNRGGRSLQVQVVPARNPDRRRTLIHSLEVHAGIDQHSVLFAEVGYSLASAAVWE